MSVNFHMRRQKLLKRALHQDQAPGSSTRIKDQIQESGSRIRSNVEDQRSEYISCCSTTQKDFINAPKESQKNVANKEQVLELVEGFSVLFLGCLAVFTKGRRA